MKSIEVPNVMKEAYNYGSNPATFCRGVVISCPKEFCFVSGTASVGPNGETLHKGDFVAQVNRMFDNVTVVLKGANKTWGDVIRTTIYLRDIDRDYEEFNKARKIFYDKQGLNAYPASTCIEAKICRSDLLCEMEVIAVGY
ncbi:MAG: RidA family protein [Synergistaceae bacterium]